MQPTQSPSMVTRIVVAKAIGLLFGIAGFALAPSVVPDVDALTRFGILLWYPTMGAFIGVFGVFNYHPVLAMRLPWWVRGPIIGAWLNLVLVLFAYDKIAQFADAIIYDGVSPFVFVLEGVIVGGVIAFVATATGGEGPQTLGA